MSPIKERIVLNVKESVNKGSVELQMSCGVGKLNDGTQVEQRFSKVEVLQKTYCRIGLRLPLKKKTRFGFRRL